MLRASLLTNSPAEPAELEVPRTQARSAPTPRMAPRARPVVAGKFIVINGRKFYMKGVTYGPFAPDAQGCEYHDPQTVRRDLQTMSAAGINCIRTYTAAPIWLLDLADEFDMKVMVGLPWEQ